jgi:predicted Rossmann fold nucleotide-binding protein DprA/Smf involved in DNA uptake
MTTIVHPDSLATVLLCSHLALPKGERADARPLSPSQWHSLLDKLRASSWEEPGDLLEHSAAEISETLGLKPESAERIVRLLDRGGQLAFELERLESQGIWVLTEAEEGYPALLTERLGEQAPPVLFGAGPIDLLSRSGIAIVGSRDLDPDGEQFARAVGERCAREGLTVISGGARGADRIGMLGSLLAGGQAVGVLAESLAQALRDREAGQFIRDDQLTLVTPFHPSAGFNAGNAMARNKLLYCLSQLAVVVSSGEGSGGTWHGATENLDRGWVPLFVRAGQDVPAGNRALLDRGGIPLIPDELPPEADLLACLLEGCVRHQPADAPTHEQLRLL